MGQIEDVRSVAALWPFRQRRHVVIVCVDDPREFTAARRELVEMNAELVIEETSGPSPARLAGRLSPSRTDSARSVSGRLKPPSTVSFASSRASNSRVPSAVPKLGATQGANGPIVDTRERSTKSLSSSTPRSDRLVRRECRARVGARAVLWSRGKRNSPLQTGV